MRVEDIIDIQRGAWRVEILRRPFVETKGEPFGVFVTKVHDKKLVTPGTLILFGRDTHIPVRAKKELL